MPTITGRSKRDRQGIGLLHPDFGQTPLQSLYAADIQVNGQQVTAEGRKRAYVGTTGLSEAAGFEPVVETASKSGGKTRWLMRKGLA